MALKKGILLAANKAYINGDEEQTGVFTFADNADQVNVKVIFTTKELYYLLF